MIELIRKEADRLRLRGLLLESAASVPAAPADTAYFNALRARHIDRARLAPLRGKLRRGEGGFDLEAFRDKPHARALRH